MLNGHEQRVLTAIEQQLLAEDPDLCRTLSAGPEAVRRRWCLAAAVTTIAFGLLVAVGGLLLLSLGLTFFGCLVAGAGWTGYLYVRGATAGGDRPEPGGDVGPTWWTWA